MISKYSRINKFDSRKLGFMYLHLSLFSNQILQFKFPEFFTKSNFFSHIVSMRQ